ncbi:MAG TPA: fibronectin type III domain-containing protein [Steroidobacteraceae bacterium]|nr:fibronectin type III domain-containing protein [Steroidobacteraceae bacterium]
MTPKLTWSTTPTAKSCTASGGWSGTKAASGSQTLAAIYGNTNFTLTCSWSSGSAVVRWTAPTKNSDGSALTDLASFKVMYGTSSTSFTKMANVSDPTARSFTVGSLSPATWYFKVHVVNSKGIESGDSNVASKAVSGATAAKTVSVSVSSSSAKLTTKATNVWDLQQRSDGDWVRRAVVASIPLGKPCDPAIKVSDKHYAITKSDVTRYYATPKSTTLVVNCVG